MEKFASTVSSKEYDLEFTKLLDQKIVSLKSPVEDPDIDQETKLFKCRGTAAFKCHHELGPYHLEVKGEKCDPSYDQWVLIWKLLSCSGAVHAEVIDNSLNDLIKKTKWYLEDDLMIGILMVANSKKVIPFIEDTWYLEESDLLCSVCLRPALRFFCTKTRKCDSCARQNFRRLLDKIHYPTMLDNFHGRMLTIPPGMDAFVFPVNRMSSSRPCPIQYFYKLDKFLKKCVREGIVPGKYFKMPNTVEE